MITDALGTDKPGSLIEIQGMPYLLDEGLNLETVKIEAEQAENSRPDSFRCRHGWHDMEVIAKPEPLPPITSNGALLSHYMYLAFHSGDLKRCRRCKKLAIGAQ